MPARVRLAPKPPQPNACLLAISRGRYRRTAQKLLVAQQLKKTFIVGQVARNPYAAGITLTLGT